MRDDDRHEQSPDERALVNVPAFEDLVGCEVSGVSFVRDYVEVLFDGPVLRGLASPMVREGERVARFPEPGSRDALCRLIGRKVELAEDRHDALVLTVEGPIELTISMDDPGAGYEAAHFMGMRDGRREGMSIWESLAPAPTVMQMLGGLQSEMRAVVLVGDAATFGVLGRLIGARHAATVKIAPDPQWPELDRLDALVITLADHDARISVDGTTATLAASEASLSSLAEQISLFVAYNDIDEPGMHTHMVERRAGDLDSFELMLAGPFPDVPLPDPGRAMP
jgi:hypothetical protein